MQRPAPAMQSAPVAPRRAANRRNARPKNPYREQIQQLRLQIRQLKLDLRQINNNMSQTRAGYNQNAAFMPWPIREGAKIYEDIKLKGSQPQKVQLQQQIQQLEQQLLGLEQQQLVWKREQGLL